MLSDEEVPLVGQGRDGVEGILWRLCTKRDSDSRVVSRPFSARILTPKHAERSFSCNVGRKRNDP